MHRQVLADSHRHCVLGGAVKIVYFWCEASIRRNVLAGHSYTASCARKWIRRGSELVEMHLKNRRPALREEWIRKGRRHF